ncbi:Phospholipase D zeta 1 like [Actinidia chinensis var. chinensis]|uniref:Phospholipase n=1 Tax=Actinidia chinensis var. chinensis TaxID=1590841 RepID=A0A2R6Q704_ACTCC|nr:Phospholipase D zeta 1 like [Actinidia chinensis var. chinensis]
MSSEKLLHGGDASHYVQIPPDKFPTAMSSSYSFRFGPEPARIFEELPNATIVSVSRTDASDISPLQFSYTIELQYKQFKWWLLKKASQVIYLHFALKKRAIIEEFHEKQEQVKEWLHSFGIGDQTAVVDDNDEPDDGAVPVHHEVGPKNRYVPSRAALPIIRPTLGAQQTISENAKGAMQGYLNHFLGNMDIVNSREVCKFLEVSKLSFLQEYGPKLKEGYVTAKHLAKIPKDEDCHLCRWFDCCNTSWQKVWAVLKPGFFALMEDPFGTNLLDIIVFDVLPASSKDGEDQVHLAEEIKERNPLRYTFKVSGGNRSIKLRTTSKAKVKEWASAINDAALKPPEGWCHPHRFGSFAPPRGLIEDGSQAQWFIDGQSAFDAIASSIENAKSEIYITGWWLCPELYLRRPFHSHGSSRLDALLEDKAKQGVQIYILLYKEVALALKINSLYSKKKLLHIHENVKVMRYPDHFSTGVYLWSHHEKLVIVDYQICFIGGLDLCFGRYDTIEHKVGDCPPFMWPGKDYYNPRESEPNSWEDIMTDELDRGKYPRMPWHDVHCALWGPACRDIARHFVQRWNHAKRNKAPNEQTIPLLMPQHHMVLPHYMGRSTERDIESNAKVQKDINIQDTFSSRTPLEEIPLLMPREAGELHNLDNKLNGLDKNQHHLDQPRRVGQGLSFSLRKSKVEPLIPDMQLNGFVDDLDFVDLQGEMSVNAVTQADMKISDEWWETQEQGDQDVSAHETAQVGPRTPCRCQVIRSVSQWSAGNSQPEDSIHRAYCSLIEKSEHFVYIENQFFISGLSGDEIIQNRILEVLYRRILRAYKEQKCFRVVIVIPLLPGFQGRLDDGGAATVRAIMHWQYRTISRGKNSILHKLNALLGSKADDYISFYGLRTYGRLSDDGPLVTSQIYVHSKVLIIDDRVSLIGSSNINDRSLLGSRDSEICVVVEDTEFLESSMNGEPWKAGKFALSLRLSLWSEHLGLHTGEIKQISDPIADSTYKELWLATAKTNTAIFQEVFRCVPNDVILSRSAFRQSMSQWKEKIGHTTTDLGVAPEKLEYCKDGETKAIDPMDKLKSVRGFLVLFPMEFMSQEDLRPVFVESEFYASPQVFH